MDREGIGHLTRKDLVREANRGRVIRLVAEVGEEGLARVRPAALPPGDPLALVSGTSSAVTLTTDLMGSLTILEHSPALGQTAYGVFRDLLEIAGRD